MHLLFTLVPNVAGVAVLYNWAGLFASPALWRKGAQVSAHSRGRAFDALATEMASGTLSRGRMLKLMGAALLGGTLGSLGGIAAADEECKAEGRKCRKDDQYCSGNCVNGTCSACPVGRTKLSNGTCAKPCDSADDCPFCTCTSEGSRTFFNTVDGASLTDCRAGGDSVCPRGELCIFSQCRRAC
jgi:hypothetical protein